MAESPRGHRPHSTSSTQTTYAEPWQRASLGMNWYVNGHALKFSVMHRESFNTNGVGNVRSRATYLQSHFAF